MANSEKEPRLIPKPEPKPWECANCHRERKGQESFFSLTSFLNSMGRGPRVRHKGVTIHLCPDCANKMPEVVRQKVVNQSDSGVLAHKK